MNSRANRSPRIGRTRRTTLLLAVILTFFSSMAWGQADNPVSEKSKRILQRAIEAMGGSAYRGVETAVHEGRLFFFSKGRKALTRYWDWTVYKDPIKSRNQLGKGKRQTVMIHNMALEQGWKLEGETSVEPLSEDEMKSFFRSVRRDLDYILRNRLDEEGLSFFYYGPDDISGSGEWEAVEMIDLTNDSIVVYVDRESHLPVKVETQITDGQGVRLKRETEFYNWHEIGGVLTPLRFDSYVDGEIAQQLFVEQIEFNVPIDESYFREPVVKKDKKKK